MTNDQAKFFGACFIAGCSVLAIPLGIRAGRDAEICGIIGVIAAAIIGLPALLRLGSSKDL